MVFFPRGDAPRGPWRRTPPRGPGLWRVPVILPAGATTSAGSSPFPGSCPAAVREASCGGSTSPGGYLSRSHLGRLGNAGRGVRLWVIPARPFPVRRTPSCFFGSGPRCSPRGFLIPGGIGFLGYRRSGVGYSSCSFQRPGVLFGPRCLWLS